MNSPDAYSITYLTGAGMMVDLAAWILIGLGMLATSFSIGMLLAVARKRRIERNAAAELQMNWFAQIKPTDPAFSVPVLSELKWVDEQWVKDMRRDNIAILERAAQNQRQPAAPACGVTQSCNACSECPDLERKS